MNATPTIDPLQALKAAELAAALSPVLSALDAIAKGDGSTASITGQGVALEGQFIAILPVLQKIGVNGFAQILHDKLSAWIAEQSAPATGNAPESSSGN